MRVRQRQGARGVDAQALAGHRRLADRPRVEGAHAPLQLERRTRPVQPRLGLVELGRVGDADLGLGLRRGPQAGAQQAQAVLEHFRAQRGETVVQRAAGLVGGDGCFQRQQHRPGVQALLHLHQAHAGALVAGLDGALDRRGAAPARQQRGVHVPAAIGGDGEHRGRQDQPVGHDDEQVRCERSELLAGLHRPEVLRLVDRDPARQGFELDRGGLQLAAAPGGSVGLGVGRHHLATARRRTQGRHGELRRAGEDQAQRHQAASSPSRFCLASLRLTSSRLSGER